MFLSSQKLSFVHQKRPQIFHWPTFWKMCEKYRPQSADKYLNQLKRKAIFTSVSFESDLELNWNNRVSIKINLFGFTNAIVESIYYCHLTPNGSYVFEHICLKKIAVYLCSCHLSQFFVNLLLILIGANPTFF